jgi:hypothetical protein
MHPPATEQTIIIRVGLTFYDFDIAKTTPLTTNVVIDIITPTKNITKNL